MAPNSHRYEFVPSKADLLEMLRKADEPCRSLDVPIFRYLHPEYANPARWTFSERFGMQDEYAPITEQGLVRGARLVPWYTSSLDALLVLMPPDYGWHIQKNPEVNRAWASIHPGSIGPLGQSAKLHSHEYPTIALAIALIYSKEVK